jgi:hypothetical protein
MEALLSPQEKASVTHLYYASRQEGGLRELIKGDAVFPNIVQQTTLYANFSPNPTSPHFRVENKQQLYAMTLATPRAPLDAMEHWTIQTLGNEWLAGARQLHDSYFVGLGTDGDKGPVALPEKYVVIQPYSTNARRVYRDVSTEEWQAILMWLTRIGLKGVVLNKGGEDAIASRQLIDLTNRTTLMQAIRIVNGASAYAGTSSCFSVLAAKRLPEDKLLIKGHQSLKEKWHKVYYAPHRSGRFIYQDLTFLALHGS